MRNKNFDLTNEQKKKIIEQYLQEDRFELPIMGISQKDLEKEIPVIDPISLKSVMIPKNVSWDYFWNTGLITLVNNILLPFGFALCEQRDSSGNIVSAVPTRTPVRVLSEETTNAGIEKLLQFLEINAKTLNDESYFAEAIIKASIAETNNSNQEDDNLQNAEESENLPITSLEK